MTERLGNKADREVWARLSRGSPGAAPSPTELAAWLDGRLDAAAAARVEEALTADPDLLDAVLDARAVAVAGTPAAPDRLIGRARAVVAPAPTSAGTTNSGRAGFWRGWWGQGVQWGAVTVMALAISFGGFMLGDGTQTALAGQRIGGTGMLFAVLDSIAGADLPVFDDGGSEP